jgi:hypothetical protein
MSTRHQQRWLAKTASYTIKPNADHAGTRFSNRGASGSVTFTLPAPALGLKGWWYVFEVHANQTVIVAGHTTGKIATLGNAAADNVSYAITSNKIGRKILAECDGTQWLCVGLGPAFCVNGLQITPTVAEMADIIGTSLTAAELALIDGAGAAGAITASKVVTRDAAKGIPFFGAVVAAVGNSQGTAAALTADRNLVTDADGTKAVTLPTAVVGQSIRIVNTSASSPLPVYPATGAAINGGSANAAFTIGAGRAAEFHCSAALTWTCEGSAAATATVTEQNYVDVATPGTVEASKALVVDANKALDTVRVTGTRTIGGTGVPAAAGVVYEFVKEVTAIPENTATTILTVTVPNAAHACALEIDVMGRQGAGGTIGADESVSVSKYLGAISRTAGVASVVAMGAQLGVANAKVAGGDTLTAVLTVTDTGEGVGATNTHLIKVTIDSTNNSSGNHKCMVRVRLHNANATGITIA